MIRARLILTALLTFVAWRPCVAQGTPGVPGAVAARRISRGAVITSDDVAGPSAVVTGWIARRVIQPGEVLAAPAIAAPSLVRARQSVDVLVGGGSIRVLVPGTALADATLGDTVLVRLDTKRRVRAVVSGPGRVTAIALSSR